jgi:two-component system response regulator FixJ
MTIPTARTIYLVDDNAEFRASAQWWLSGSGYVVQAFGDAEEALPQLARLDAAQRQQACLLLDVRMPGLSGLDLHDRLNDCGVTHPVTGLPVIYMSGHADVPLAVEAMRKGAITVIEKPLDNQVLESALEQAFSARESQAPVCADFQRRLAQLTPRERQVLAMVVDGCTSKVIARALGISIKTADLHRSRMMGKMQADSVVHLTRMVITRRVSG